MTLNQWVKQYGGAEKLAVKLEITPHAVRNWMRGDDVPRPKHLVQLVKLSKGKLSFESILTATMK